MARTKGTQLITRPYVKSPSTPDTATPAKEYVNEGRALRIQTVINDPTDLGVLPRLTTSTTCTPKPVPSTADC
jgi:hypothetical protein